MTPPKAWRAAARIVDFPLPRPPTRTATRPGRAASSRVSSARCCVGVRELSTDIGTSLETKLCEPGTNGILNAIDRRLRRRPVVAQCAELEETAVCRPYVAGK